MVSENPDHPRRVLASDIGAVYENGVLRPDHALNLPDRTRVLLSVSESAPFVPISDEEWLKAIDQARMACKISTKGWTFNRDDLYERD